jgi:hypothetical protein
MLPFAIPLSDLQPKRCFHLCKKSKEFIRNSNPCYIPTTSLILINVPLHLAYMEFQILSLICNDYELTDVQVSGHFLVKPIFILISLTDWTFIGSVSCCSYSDAAERSPMDCPSTSPRSCYAAPSSVLPNIPFLSSAILFTWTLVLMMTSALRWLT